MIITTHGSLAGHHHHPPDRGWGQRQRQGGYGGFGDVDGVNEQSAQAIADLILQMRVRKGTSDAAKTATGCANLLCPVLSCGFREVGGQGGGNADAVCRATQGESGSALQAARVQRYRHRQDKPGESDGMPPCPSPSRLVLVRIIAEILH